MARPLVTVVCSNCGIAFQREKNRVQASNKHGLLFYCCSACAAKATKTSKSIQCVECGKTVTKKPSEFKSSRNLFCSQSCAAVYNNRVQPKKVKSIEVSCMACSRKFMRSPQEIKRDKELNRVVTCSKPCLTYMEIQLGLKQPKLKERKLGPVTKPKTCKTCETFVASDRVYCRKCYKADNEKVLSYTIGSIRELYKDRGGMAFAAKVRGYGATIYKGSDKPKYCVHCGYSKFYEVCHIRPVKDFPDSATMAEVHALDNLIALCPNCHWEFDHGMLVLE